MKVGEEKVKFRFGEQEAERENDDMLQVQRALKASHKLQFA
jgi:hypothetical protein